MLNTFFSSPCSLNSSFAKLHEAALGIEHKQATIKDSNLIQPFLTSRKHKQLLLMKDPTDISRKVNAAYNRIRNSTPNKRLSRPVQIAKGLIGKIQQYMSNQDDLNSQITDQNVYNFEKELFGSYNLPQNFDSAVQILAAAKEITYSSIIQPELEEGKANYQIRSKFPSRKQIVLLGKWIDYRKTKIEKESKSDIEANSKLTILYFIALLELTRQESIICVERGKLLSSVWSNYYQLQQKIVTSYQSQLKSTEEHYLSVLNTVTSSKDDILLFKNEKINEVNTNNLVRI